MRWSSCVARSLTATCVAVVAPWIVASPSVVRAQYGAHWVTGVQASGATSNGMVMDFRTSPPTIACNAQMGSAEGSATWSDALSGDLVVYSNGLDVRTPSGLVVNGSGLEGNSTATETALFVPVPGSQAERLFVFSNNLETVYASIITVDASEPAKTAVEADSKNTLVSSGTGEAIGAVAHADGATFWLVLLNAESDSIDAYHVIDDTIPSEPTTRTPFAFLASMVQKNRASIVFAPSRQQMAVPLERMGVWVLDFDTSTGVASNERKIWGGSGYSAAFSPSGNMVYFAAPAEGPSGEGWQAPLRQYDLSAGEETTLSTDEHAGVGLGPDGKIYSAGWTDTEWTVVNDPDVGGVEKLTTLSIPADCAAGFNVSKQIDLSGTNLTPCADDGPGQDPGCTESLPACDSSGTPTCVGCLSDGDCPDSTCDVDAKTCRNPSADAGPATDAGPADAAVEGTADDGDGGGCTCRIETSPSADPLLWALLVVASALWRRRRLIR